MIRVDEIVGVDGSGREMEGKKNWEKIFFRLKKL